ncbi:MAG: hypothetical protein ACRDUA_07310 [Micromonosporaceae bacterium]
MRTFAVVAVAGVLLATSGCTDGPDAESISVSKQPVWASSQLGMNRVSGVAMADDTAVVSGHAHSERLAAVDGETGRVRWTIDDKDPLPGGKGARAHAGSGYDGFRDPSGEPLVVRDGDEWSAVVGYSRTRTTAKARVEEHGLALVSVNDGAVEWLSPPLTAGRAEVDDNTIGETVGLRGIGLGAVGGEVVVASLRAEDEGATTEDLRMVALSTSDGRKLWEKTGVWPGAVAGDVVLGHVPKPSAPLTSASRAAEGYQNTTVVAFDAGSGERRWDLAKRFPLARLDTVAGDLAVVDAEPDPDADTDTNFMDHTVIVDVDTGRTVHKFRSLASCDSDGRALIACNAVGREGLATIRSTEREVRYSAGAVDGASSWSVTDVWKGHVFIEADGAHIVVDREGRRIGREMPGEVMAISGRYAVFASPGADGSDARCAGYRVFR